MKRLFFFSIALASFAALLVQTPLRAGGPLHLTVNQCGTDAQLRDFLTQLQTAEGGTLNFSCGDATITLTSQLPQIVKETIVDGGDKITLSGNNQVRLFSVAWNARLSLKNITLEKGNSGNNIGGAIDNSGELRLQHVTLQNNKSNVDGGAVATQGPLDITDSLFRLNVGNSGGAIAAYIGGSGSFRVEISDSTFESNTARNSNTGGAIDSGAPLNIDTTWFFDNTAGAGGAIHLHNTDDYSYITNSRFTINNAVGGDPNGNGGAVLLYEADVRVEHAEMTENRAATNGGAFYLFPNTEFELKDSTLDSNRADAGAGLYNRGTASVYNDTFLGNSATDHGGAINNSDKLWTSNSTFTKNVADYGGVLYNQGGNASLIHVTISNNSALVAASGIMNALVGSPQLWMRNVIVANSERADSCLFQTPPLSSTFNLSTDNSCQFGTGRDRVLINLGPLANNGGPTQTFMPLAGSPAIEGGGDADFAVDQRGGSRPRGTTYDVGAVEVQPDCATKPSKPTILQPKNKEKVDPFGASLDWSDPPCAQKYKVLIRKGSPQGAKFQKKGGLVASYLITKALMPGKTYAWRVTAFNNKGKVNSVWKTFKADKEK